MKKLTFILSSVVALTLTINAAEPLENFGKHCATCHGKDGKGQTTMGKKLNTPDLTTKEVKSEEAFKILKEGLKKDGKEIKKSFSGKLTDDEIKALVEYVKIFNKK